jgi:conjugative relaxase-like TrwC/TraI family protein
MLPISKPRGAAAARHYYKQDDYHPERGRITGEWFGEGARKLGLEGNVLQRDFENMLRGRDPHDHSQLVETARANGKHRGGWDATFSAPKSLSIQALAGEDYRLFDAHREATLSALTAIEEHVQTRDHGKRVTSGNMVAAVFEHYSSRAGDPQLRSHGFVMNLTLRADGEWRAIEPRTLFQAQHLGTEVYRDTLAEHVQALGYEIVRDERGRHGEWELAGYDREVIMAFSQRRQEIERDLSDNGIGHGAHAQQLAAYRTRAEKLHTNEHELQAEWQERAQSLSLDVRAMTERAYDRQYERQHEWIRQQQEERPDVEQQRALDKEHEERQRRARVIDQLEQVEQEREQDRGWGWGR